MDPAQPSPGNAPSPSAPWNTAQEPPLQAPHAITEHIICGPYPDGSYVVKERQGQAEKPQEGDQKVASLQDALEALEHKLNPQENEEAEGYAEGAKESPAGGMMGGGMAEQMGAY